MNSRARIARSKLIGYAALVITLVIGCSCGAGGVLLLQRILGQGV